MKLCRQKVRNAIAAIKIIRNVSGSDIEIENVRVFTSTFTSMFTGTFT